MAAISWTSAVVMCRASARGCTVIPGDPASTQTCTASITEGVRPPRELRTVAILLTLTDSLTTDVTSDHEHDGSRLEARGSGRESRVSGRGSPDSQKSQAPSPEPIVQSPETS